MKFINIGLIILYILSILGLIFPSVIAGSDSDLDTMESLYPKLLQSNDFKTRITSIILSGEFKKTSLTTALKDMLKNSEGIERTAIFYALSRTESDDYIEPFIDSIVIEPDYINLLLSVESPQKSYFASPYFKMLDYLFSICWTNDEALKKLEAISQFADGWQGDKLDEMILDLKELKQNPDKK